MENNVDKILYEISKYSDLRGNVSLKNILSDFGMSIEEKYLALKSLNKKLNFKIQNDEEEDLEEDTEENSSKKRVYFCYIFDRAIDCNNLRRIELQEGYSVKSKREEYRIVFYLKFPTNVEDSFVMNFKQEEERDFWFDILNIKMKELGLFVI